MKNFKYAAQVMAATAMADSIRYMSTREYLNYSPHSYEQHPFILGNGANNNIIDQSPIRWIKIDQVGRHSENSRMCFAAMQKILFSCHDAEKKQIIFLVNGNGKEVELYIGIRFIGQNNSRKACDIFAQSTASYIKTLWSGTQTKFVKGDDAPDRILEGLIPGKGAYQHLYSLTGVPSFMEGSGSESLTSLDTLIGALGDKRFTYIVIANPVAEHQVNSIIHQCNEMYGQLESVKSFDFSESFNQSETDSIAKSISEYWNESETESVSQKDKRGTIAMSLATVGLSLAASLCFPPAAGLIPVVMGANSGNKSDLMNNSIAGLGTMFGFGMNILSGLIPSKTEGHQHGRGGSEGTTTTKSFTTGQAETLSTKIVNKHAEYASKQISAHVDRFEKGLGQGMWETGVFLLADDESVAHSASMQLKAIMSGSSSYLEPVRLHNLSDKLEYDNDSSEQALVVKALRKYSMPNIPIQYKTHEGEQTINNPFEISPSHLTTYLTTEELSNVINLPQNSVPGISVIDSYPDFPLQNNQKAGLANIPIGNLLYSGTKTNLEVNLPINALNRHALVAGVNGSGKTNTVLSILNGLNDADIPFMVIEPAKTEYVDWALEYNETVSDPAKKIKIFMPGCRKYAKKNFAPEILRINPFEVIDLGTNEPRVLTHIDRLKATFAAAFPMQDILPVVLEHLLYSLYRPILSRDTLDPMYRKQKYPKLSQVNDDFIGMLMRSLGYAQENSQNISAALRTRFMSLTFGWKGEMLNNEKLEGYSWAELFGSPCIINLSYAGDDQDRAFMMSLILQFLYEYRVAESETDNYSFNDNVCRHLVVVEEAHRVMGRCESPELPQYKSGQMFSNFLSEVRAYGQGMMVVDQVPTRLIEDATKNTNIKIIHKLVASDDSQTIAECIGMTQEQQKVIAKLSIGQAVLAGFNSADVSSNSADIYLAQIDKMK